LRDENQKLLKKNEDLKKRISELELKRKNLTPFRGAKESCCSAT
jgi:hypothetical protein